MVSSQPTWVNLLSYVRDVHIESCSSEHNPQLSVVVCKGEYQLCSTNAVYSYGLKYNNFTQVFKALDWDKYQPKTALVLGLGLASIPTILETTFEKELRYTGVEIDEHVIYLSNKYVISALKSPVEIICTDAQNFVHQCKTKFDMICMDVFLDDVIPEEFEKKEFLQQLKGMLSADGLLIYNRLAYTAEDKKVSEGFYNESFLPVFNEAYNLKCKGNYMLLNHNRFLK